MNTKDNDKEMVSIQELLTQFAPAIEDWIKYAAQAEVRRLLEEPEVMTPEEVMKRYGWKRNTWSQYKCLGRIPIQHNGTVLRSDLEAMERDGIKPGSVYAEDWVLRWRTKKV